MSLWEKNYQTGLLKAFSVKHLGIEKLIETHEIGANRQTLS
ncbi:hypothetical protein MC7420_5574 [Coleofasciculus chthonoplastes PCC 7420]|uniref:Uncharacterized protein n=1 Tax=Coleofasciculus chthonoplastes PCC 7420 TaxID=118168 RepID=B4VPX0_9CYAN|nr:hypothetical protein [Coleofasciculus chthonoplastes]EDX76140.1 hypothetical protein MC7420_5574 [Coleofasciculus chthonoplastes PCC 7420]